MTGLLIIIIVILIIVLCRPLFAKLGQWLLIRTLTKQAESIFRDFGSQETPNPFKPKRHKHFDRTDGEYIDYEEIEAAMADEELFDEAELDEINDMDYDQVSDADWDDLDD